MSPHLRKSDKVQRLGELALFSSLSRRSLSRIADAVVEEHRPADTILTREGQDAGVAFVLVDGTAEVKKGRGTLATLGPGDMVGELSLLDGLPRAATVVAVTDVHLLVISKEDLGRLMEEIPELTPKVIAMLTGRIRELDTKMAALL